MKNCGHKNSLQYLYCSQCSKGLVAQDTTSEQREQLTNQVIESTLKEHGLYWKELTVRGIPSVQAKCRKEARNKVARAKEWGKKNGFPHIATIEERWDVDERFRNSMKDLLMTRDDMIEFTQLSYDRLQETPQHPALVKEHVKGKFRLTNSNSKSRNTQPFIEIPGVKEELKRNPGFIARKRKGEDEDIPVNIAPKHPARGNSAASSSNEPSYHQSTAASSNDTRRTIAKSEEVTSSSIKDWWSRPTYEDIPLEDLDSEKKLPGESKPRYQ